MLRLNNTFHGPLTRTHGGGLSTATHDAAAVLISSLVSCGGACPEPQKCQLNKPLTRLELNRAPAAIEERDRKLTSEPRIHQREAREYALTRQRGPKVEDSN